MSTQSVFRLAAAGLMVGALLFTVGAPLAAPPPDVAVGPHLLVIGFGTLLMAGVLGLYARQHTQVGILGLVGAALLFVGLFLQTSFSFVSAFLVPVLEEGAPDLLSQFPEGEWGQLLAVNIGTRLAMAAGWLLFGIATYRAAILPRWAIVVAVVPGVVQIGYHVMPTPLAVAILLLHAIGVFGLGWGLWTSVTGLTAGAATGQRQASSA